MVEETKPPVYLHSEGREITFVTLNSSVCLRSDSDNILDLSGLGLSILKDLKKLNE